MIITIDTSKDSKEDIRKLIAFLSTLSNSEQRNPDIFASSGSSAANEGSAVNAFANIFGDNSPSAPASIQEEKPSEMISSADIFTLSEKKTLKEEEDEEIPQVTLY